MFKNEIRLLPLWIKHYSIFGMENLYILDHCSTDGSTKDLDCNVEVFGRPNTPFADRQDIYSMILNKHVELLKEYQYVICADADEFVFVTPKYENLKHYIETRNNDVPACTGYEIIHQKNEKDLDWDKPILNQRSYWIRLNTYDKKNIVSRATRWSRGLHYVYGETPAHARRQNIVKQIQNENLILCHLHRVDYNNCKEKYLYENDNKVKESFPLFTNKSNFDAYFYNSNYHIIFGAAATALTKIPKEFENII